MSITCNDLDNYIVKFPTKYDYCLFKKYRYTLHYDDNKTLIFPIIFCLPDSMEENLNNLSLVTKSILFISMKDLTQNYIPINMDKKYINDYKLYVLGKTVDYVQQHRKLNIGNNVKLKLYNKIVQHYCELLFLCGQMIPVSDISIYIVGLLYK
jgi:hypothetical protein